MQPSDPNESPMVHDWTDKNWRERYIFHARENYETFKELRIASQRNHVEYGKWLIASMLAIHGGAIYAISSLQKDMPALTTSNGLVTAAVWHIAGIAFIMLAGFLAWLNFQFAEQAYFKLANPAMVYRTDADQPDGARTDPINTTLFGAAAAGVFSAWCFIAGAAEVFACLRAAF